MFLDNGNVAQINDNNQSSRVNGETNSTHSHANEDCALQNQETEVGNDIGDKVDDSRKTPTHVSFREQSSNEADEAPHANGPLPHINETAASPIREEPHDSKPSPHHDVSYIGICPTYR